MIRLVPPGDRPTRVLAIGCHSDDIEIGCGATILRLAAETRLHVTWVVLSGDDRRAAEALASAEAMLEGVESRRVVRGDFTDGFMPYEGAQVKAFFEGLKEEPRPDLILTHRRDDLHQDHRLAAELTWNTFRSHRVLEYEIPKYDGDLGQPNVFVAIDPETARRKAEHIVRHFATQGGKHWFTEDLFLGLMRIRGIESASPTGFAEGFHGRKILLESVGPLGGAS